MRRAWIQLSQESLGLCVLIVLSLELSEGKKWQRGMIDGAGLPTSNGFEAVAVNSGQSARGFCALVGVSDAFFKTSSRGLAQLSRS